jgi:uncharacterized damage-inducible protein DinB
MGNQPPVGHRTVRDLAYHVFRLALAFPDAMDSGRLPERWVRESAPEDLRDGPAVARYGALVRGRVGGWFEGAAPREYDRTLEMWDGRVSGRELLERITSQTAHHLQQLHAALEQFGHPPREPLPTADFQGLQLPPRDW